MLLFGFIIELIIDFFIATVFVFYALVFFEFGVQDKVELIWGIFRGHRAQMMKNWTAQDGILRQEKTTTMTKGIKGRMEYSRLGTGSDLNLW